MKYLIIVLAFVGFVWLLGEAWNKNEKVECARWKNYETGNDLPYWEAQQWQKDQCERWGIVLTK